MKYGFIISAVATQLLTAPLALAQADVDKVVDISLRQSRTTHQAEARAMERCDTTRADFKVPFYNSEAKTEQQGEASVTVAWTGSCKDGKRDGEGVLTWSTDKPVAPANRVTLTWEAEGRFVAGRRVGLWCAKDFRFAHNGKPEPAGIDHRACAVHASHERYLTKPYRKQPDGSWQEWINGTPREGRLAAGALEAQGARVLADALAGKTDLKAEVASTAKIMEDLLPGANITFAPSPDPIVFKDKRVAILLSSRAISEMERFKRGRQALLAASAGLAGDAAKEREKFAERSNLDRWLGKILRLVQNHSRAVKFEDDLTGLQQGKYDYALVLDWKGGARFDLLGRYEQLAPTSLLAVEEFQAYLIGRDLKAIKHVLPWPRALKPNDIIEFPFDSKGDHRYLGGLARFYGAAWGNTPDEQGLSLLQLSMLIKGQD